MPNLSDPAPVMMPGTFSRGYHQDRGSPFANVYHQTPNTSPRYPTPFTISSRSQDSRKRSRSFYNAETIFTPRNDWLKSAHSSAIMARSDFVDSPTPFINTRYELAGGMDSQQDEYEDNYGLNTREGLRKCGRQDDGYSASYHLPNLPTDANGRLRSPNRIKGDGILSKVWDFCTSAFRGFSAGGGESYPVKNASKLQEVQDEKTYDDYLLYQNLTPVPGRYPQDESDEAPFERPRSETPPRPAKRRQISTENTVDKWVMVPEVRRSSRKSTAIPRPMSRASVPRRAILAGRASTVSHAGSPALHPNRPVSFASPRSPTKLRDSAPPQSPASIEAAKWAARKRREEQETDESIRRFNSRLKAMIKEGREALGTKIEIKDLDEDHEMDDDFD